MLHGVNENEFRAQRMANLQKLTGLGYKPFGQAFQRTGRIGELKATFAEGRKVWIAGRLVTRREMGKSIFADVVDGSGRIQVYVKKEKDNPASEKAFDAFQFLDIGDQIGVEGEMFITKMGEQTVKVDSWTMLSKALLPLPEKWHGLQDVDLRYRQRYLDLIANPEVRDVFNKRIEIVRELRAYLAGRGFYEVETPMIQPMAGGAAANPFKTRYEVLNQDMYLRIAPELYLKRLLVGGFDKVFEVNRNFRNEGLSRFHNPEFTMVEIYEAYGDVRTMMELVQGVILHVAEKVVGSLKVGTKDQPVDLASPWREVPYRDLIKDKAGADWFELDAKGQRAKAESLGLSLAPEWGSIEITQEVFEKLIEKTLVNPTFVTRLPVELVPLAKACEDDATCVDVFELVIGGREIAPAYSELNDPVEQRKRFEEQAGGDASKVDEDFLTAMEHGMPPAGGTGIGIDRLVMVLTGAESIRDVILFPQMKPR
jgi:lysyl-tRNA synthetase class 2